MKTVLVHCLPPRWRELCGAPVPARDTIAHGDQYPTAPPTEQEVQMFGTITLDVWRRAIVASRSLLLISGQDPDSLADQGSRGCPGHPIMPTVGAVSLT
jgi:hypothetical protein